jgi:MFS family permease
MRFVIDLRPLWRHAGYRRLYLGQLVSFLGSMITYVALPYHLFEVTHSTAAVGLLGVVQLVPLVLTGMWGGVLADRLDRRRLIVTAELGLVATCSALVLIVQMAPRAVWPVYALAGLMAALNGIHRPALESLTPRLVPREDLPAVSALSSLKSNFGMIAGPAIGGLLIARGGAALAFGVDALSYGASLFAILGLRGLPSAPERGAARGQSLRDLREGFAYAKGRQELIGTYVVDMVAMAFAMPTPLFPAFAEKLGGPAALGWLYSATSVGALCATLTSGWTGRVRRHGLAVLLAAAGWCAAMMAFGSSTNFILALLCLGVAGFSDMISGIFRSTIWNETIPDSHRGRLASLEMISYSSGPLIGGTQCGFLASAFGTAPAIVVSGAIGLAGIGVCARLLPGFRDYLASPRSGAGSADAGS